MVRRTPPARGVVYDGTRVAEEHHMKIRTGSAGVAILIALSVPSMAYALPTIGVENFQPSQACGCHGDLLEQWSRGMHAKALTDPLYRYKVAEADKATNGTLGDFCDGCHGPVATMGGQTADLSKASVQAVEGVGCDFCHQVTGAGTPLGNVSQVVTPDGVKRAQFDDALSPAHTTQYSQFHETAEFCGACHNVDHPGNGMHLETTYTEWKEGPYAEQGIVCQDCHMTPGPGVTKPNAGTAAAGGPQRQHIYTMTFVGGNVGLGDAQLAEERLKAAATLEITVNDVVAPGASEDVTVKVTNSGAGHGLPTGLTEVRQMWLEVTAIAEDGTVTELGKHEYGTVLKDASGKSPVELWEAVGIEKDDRIPPQGSSTDTFSFTMPESGTAKISAALYYRSCSEDMAEAAGVEIPITTMAETFVPVYDSADAQDDAIAEQNRSGSGTPPLFIVFWGIVAFAVIGSAVVAIRKRIAKR